MYDAYFAVLFGPCGWLAHIYGALNGFCGQHGHGELHVGNRPDYTRTAGNHGQQPGVAFEQFDTRHFRHRRSGLHRQALHHKRLFRFADCPRLRRVLRLPGPQHNGQHKRDDNYSRHRHGRRGKCLRVFIRISVRTRFDHPGSADRLIQFTLFAQQQWHSKHFGHRRSGLHRQAPHHKRLFRFADCPGICRDLRVPGHQHNAPV